MYDNLTSSSLHTINKPISLGWSFMITHFCAAKNPLDRKVGKKLDPYIRAKYVVRYLNIDIQLFKNLKQQNMTYFNEQY